MSQRKSAAVVLGVTALLAPSLSACSVGDDEPDNQAVILSTDRDPLDVPRSSKTALAHVIWDEVARRLQD